MMIFNKYLLGFRFTEPSLHGLGVGEMVSTMLHHK
ncbi:hypothetical protein E9G_05462 [Moraxella catarrhalis 7169]|nr:hypothetical protein E9G_05462 [Moraxella catarrhalis 7169]